MHKKESLLFLMLAGFFITNAIVAEFIGVKIFSLEATLGIEPINWRLFGISGSLEFSAGVLPWPVVFIVTDIINEYYGKKGVKQLSYIAAALIAYAFLIVFMAIQLSPAEWWTSAYGNNGISDAQSAFQSVFGQGLWIIVGSLVAFLIGQIMDAIIFHRLRGVTGKNIGMRATLSTLISQLFDSFIVLYIGFVLPGTMSLAQFSAIGLVNYTYKVLAAICLIPLLYLAHRLIRSFLGDLRAEKLVSFAAQDRLTA